MGIDDHKLQVDDLDICVPTDLLETLRSKQWQKNSYRGVETYRRSYDISDLEPMKRAVKLDAGMGVHQWSYGEARSGALLYPGDGDTPEYTQGYSVIHPLKQLAWYGALNRAKDGPRITFLETHIVPRLGELAQFARNGEDFAEQSRLWSPQGANNSGQAVVDGLNP